MFALDMHTTVDIYVKNDAEPALSNVPQLGYWMITPDKGLIRLTTRQSRHDMLRGASGEAAWELVNCRKKN